MSIRVKFNLAMLLVFSLGFGGAIFLVRDVLVGNAKDEGALKARIMVEATNSGGTTCRILAVDTYLRIIRHFQ